MCTLRIRFSGIPEADEYLVPHKSVPVVEDLLQRGYVFDGPGTPLLLDLWSPEQPPVLLNVSALASLSVERCDEYLKELIERTKNS